VWKLSDDGCQEEADPQAHWVGGPWRVDAKDANAEAVPAEEGPLPGSPSESAASAERQTHAHMVISVKNTFLDVVENSSDESAGDEAVQQSRPLPPKLDFISPDVSAEELAVYRMKYQKFRIGKAKGAKGEMSSLVGDGRT
jgi:hypothetical protein